MNKQMNTDFAAARKACPASMLSQETSSFTRERVRRDNERMKTKTAWATPLIILATCLTACSRKEQAGPPPATVVVATVTQRDVPVVKESVATLDGFINANINAQVQGYLISRNYKEGSVVKKGDLLFQIDPRPFEASLAQAKATLAKDKAMQQKASADQTRAMQLFVGKVISGQERDAAIAAAESNKANVEGDEAAVKTAELNLGYTKITAPVDGVAGIASAQVGDLVGPATGTLTTVSQLDPIKTTVNLGEQGFTEFLTKHRDPDERERYLSGLEFELILADGSVFPEKGSFYAQDRHLDAKTGSIKMEITFPNPGNLLRPGPVWESAHDRRNQEGSACHPAGSRNRVAGQPGSYGCRSSEQDGHASGQDGRAFRRVVGSSGRSQAGRQSRRRGNAKDAARARL